jgi:hypothetical protein
MTNYGKVHSEEVSSHAVHSEGHPPSPTIEIEKDASKAEEQGCPQPRVFD